MRLHADELRSRVGACLRARRTATTTATASCASTHRVVDARLRMVDIGANLTDPMYQGVYHERTYHAPDLDAVLQRAWQAGLKSIFVTAGSLADAERALALISNTEAQTEPRLRLLCTVGVHPTRCLEEFGKGDPSPHIERLWGMCKRAAASGALVAIGECGLDYDRLQFCPAAVQRRCFEAQFALAERSKLPMFFHMCNAADDFLSIVRRNRSRFAGGVVHSFDGSERVAKEILALDLYIGINGCSVRTDENLAVVKTLPQDRLLIETDAPWCEVRKTHSSWPLLMSGNVPFSYPRVDKKKIRNSGTMTSLVKGRNEPCELNKVLYVLARAREEDPIVLAEQIMRNTERCFPTTIVACDK